MNTKVIKSRELRKDIFKKHLNILHLNDKLMKNKINKSALSAEMSKCFANHLLINRSHLIGVKENIGANHMQGQKNMIHLTYVAPEQAS